jgi:hypothetical protein
MLEIVQVRSMSWQDPTLLQYREISCSSMACCQQSSALVCTTRKSYILFDNFLTNICWPLMWIRTYWFGRIQHILVEVSHVRGGSSEGLLRGKPLLLLVVGVTGLTYWEYTLSFHSPGKVTFGKLRGVFPGLRFWNSSFPLAAVMYPSLQILFFFFFWQQIETSLQFQEAFYNHVR